MNRIRIRAVEDGQLIFFTSYNKKKRNVKCKYIITQAFPEPPLHTELLGGVSYHYLIVVCVLQYFVDPVNDYLP